RSSLILLKTVRCSRRVSMKPHQRKQARWFDTFGCATPSRSTSWLTLSSRSVRSSSRIRSRIGSPSPRKYFATRSVLTGPAGQGMAQRLPCCFLAAACPDRAVLRLRPAHALGPAGRECAGCGPAADGVREALRDALPHPPYAVRRHLRRPEEPAEGRRLHRVV